MYNEQDPANPQGIPRPTSKLARKQVYQDDPVTRRAMNSVLGRNLGQAMASAAQGLTHARTAEEHEQMSTPDESGLYDSKPLLEKAFSKDRMAGSGWEEI